MSTIQRWTAVTLCFGATYAVGCRLFIAAMREADEARRAIGRGRAYDSFLADYGHLVFVGCVLVSAVDGTSAAHTRFNPLLRDGAVYAFALWCALILWVDTKLGRHFRDAGAETRALITDGPYALVRHPRYLCWIGLLVSVAFVADSTAGLVAAGGFLLLVLRRIRREEHFMRAHRDGYAAYAARTKRLIPWVY